MKKKLVSALLVAAMAVSACACGNSETPASTQTGSEVSSEASSEVSEVVEMTQTPWADMEYEEASAYLYDANLGEFYDAYSKAFEAATVSERYALMAVAEAKLMESGVMLPLQSHGGNYAISRSVPGTTNYTLWGTDNERMYRTIVTTEIIKAEDRAEMKSKWYELRGTGTYEEWVRNFLSEKNYEIKDSFAEIYSSDPQTWDVLATSRAADSEPVVNTYDGLLEYDNEGVQQPALAESYTVSDDGLTYTFTIRKGVTWVDSQGRKVADVTAKDFVTGLHHAMDAMGGLEFLIDGKIVNASEYMYGEITDFDQVGVKAVDDYTLEFTLNEPCTYFLTMLGYSLFAPLNEEYYVSQGGKFGAEYDASAADYLYGSDPDHIAYCGPFLITSATANNSIVFKANPTYWNADAQNLKSYTMMFNDGTDATKSYNDTIAGTIDGAGLNAAALESAKADGNFEPYAYVAATDATSFMAFFNINRAVFANVNDDTTVKSPQTEEDALRTKWAMNNVHFRRALAFSLDRGAYMAQSVGEDLKYASMRNSYTPGDFVALEEDVTIDINGTATTFKAGTFYGEIMQAQINADGVKITVWDPSQNEGAGSSDYFDGWFNAANAAEELASAVEELKAVGVEVSAENPIYVDLPYYAGSETYTNRANALKQSVESALGGAVIVNLTECVDAAQWYYAGYYTDYGYEANYDIYDVSGWGPDYGDPSSYLDTFLPEYAGYMIKCIGIY